MGYGCDSCVNLCDQQYPNDSYSENCEEYIEFDYFETDKLIVGGTYCWLEMSWYRYTETILDWNNSEYADGNWNYL